MSQENLEAVRAVYKRWRDGDFHSTVDLLDPHVVLVLDPRFAASIFGPSHGGNAYYGAEAV